jgi:ABC-type multidrug transport system fused ATPase/permease subunit
MANATWYQAVEAVKRVNAHHFISSFPNGYKTEVGKEGCNLHIQTMS